MKTQWQVTLDQGIGQPENWRVVEIKHKYIDLFHQALDAHETAFPGSRALGRFHIDPEKENGFEPIFEQARARARLVDQATRLYQESIIPIDTVAKIIGVDAIDAAKGLRFRSNINFDSCIGTEQERSQATNQMSGVREFMVDPVTLSIWQEIGLLEVLGAIPDLKVQVVQATLDELAVRVEQAEQSVKQKGGSLEAHANGVSYTVTTKDQRKRYLEECQNLLMWCRTKAEVVPTEALELLSKDEAARVLSSASTSMLATAVQSGRPCLIEDRRLRVLASSVGVKRAGWTQTLLMQLVAEDVISRETYVRIIAALHRQRVGFISVGGEDLLTTLSAEGGNSDFKDLVDALALPTVERRSLANVISNFITEVWLRTELLNIRDSISSSLLEIVLVRPDGIDVFKTVAVIVNNNLSSQSFAMSIISNFWSGYIEGFVRGHFIPHLLVSD